MSLITSCPACGTMFRVVPDQLKISEGWVRCGHCSDVFDATANLSDETMPASLVADTMPAAPAQQAAAAPPAQDEALIHAWEATAGAPLSVSAALAANPVSRPGSLASPPPPTPAPAWEPEPERLEPSSLDAPFVFRRSEFTDADPTPSVLPPTPPAPDSRERAPGDDAAVEQVSFVRQARRRAFWRSPFIRLVLAFTGFALAALLMLQVAYQDRDRLAAAQPQLRPALDRMCELLLCRIGPPRQIESVVIESSGFNRLRNDTYRLTFSLRNNATVPVATPAMELTLTDSQDQPLLRRVLTPEELGARQPVIEGGAEWGGSLGLVLAAGGAQRVAGYRLLAFYP